MFNDIQFGNENFPQIAPTFGNHEQMIFNEMLSGESEPLIDETGCECEWLVCFALPSSFSQEQKQQLVDMWTTQGYAEPVAIQ